MIEMIDQSSNKADHFWLPISEARSFLPNTQPTAKGGLTFPSKADKYYLEEIY